MLIKCPRCGFQQPKDKYCAQCGVDMETFKPKVPPAWKRILGSPLLQLSLLILVAGAVGTLLYSKGQQRLERRVRPLTSSLQVSSSKNDPAFLDDNNTSPTEGEETNTPTATPQADGSLNAYKVAPGSQPPAATESPHAGNPQVIVYYAEIGRDALISLFVASRNSGQFMEFSDYSAGLVPSLSKILSNPQIKVLHKEVKSLESAKTLQWFYGIKDPKDQSLELGMTTFLGVNEIENGALRGNIEIQRSWREPLTSGGFENQKKSFPAEFEIDTDSGFFISGVMPRRSYLDNDQELSNIDVYKVLSSTQFRSGESHFVIFLDFENGNQ